MAERLLVDECELENVAPSHSPTPLYKRACDFAVTALGTWFPEFPVPTGLYRVYRADELAQAREWLRQRVNP